MTEGSAGTDASCCGDCNAKGTGDGASEEGAEGDGDALADPAAEPDSDTATVRTPSANGADGERGT